MAHSPTAKAALLAAGALPVAIQLAERSSDAELAQAARWVLVQLTPPEQELTARCPAACRGAAVLHVQGLAGSRSAPALLGAPHRLPYSKPAQNALGVKQCLLACIDVALARLACIDVALASNPRGWVPALRVMFLFLFLWP